jgi:hypothetical protein
VWTDFHMTTKPHFHFTMRSLPPFLLCVIPPPRHLIIILTRSSFPSEFLLDTPCATKILHPQQLATVPRSQHGGQIK